MNDTLRIVPDRTADCDRFSFIGNIDAQAEAIMKNLPAQVRKPVVTLDFAETGRINSMGIALLLRCLKTIRQEKAAEIRLQGLNQMNNMLFKMTGVFLLATPAKS